MTKDRILMRSRLSAIESDIRDLVRRAGKNSDRLNTQGGMLNNLARERKEWATRGAVEHLDQQIPVGLKRRLQELEMAVAKMAVRGALDPIEASANGTRSTEVEFPTRPGWWWYQDKPGAGWYPREVLGKPGKLLTLWEGVGAVEVALFAGWGGPVLGAPGEVQR